MRKPFVVANWKMHKNVAESVAFINQIKDQLPAKEEVEVGIAGTTLALHAMAAAADQTDIQIVAQNAFTEFEGAYTGEISPKALADSGVDYVLLGHIERRTMFNENNTMVNKKVVATLQAGMTPIICTDETMMQEEHGGSIHYVFAQLKDVLCDVSFDQIKNIIISYEPSWAVGAGQFANPLLAEEGCRQIRQTIADRYSYEVADKIRILYGGSVNPDNIAELMSKRDIDGVLIGRASLDADNFVSMVKTVQALNK
ncbi:triose-phosphate isomerase [Limosilactobacillus equigenerosi]|uniref:Triosephosphate isomerase n=1 Tax=Limosilactobacillus equigenerosi DSM 18793 = JCM 14505 TaxID=1423742 RepID=A0A0R1UT42_9LACO|nr:triose-phosphate isomerase [Limosilactobacillus equigenerosi]KRL96295.1 Triose-phosphate isomerase [Limosilactobacillus equigenerosi DSM 18793 = JCM 14505]